MVICMNFITCIVILSQYNFAQKSVLGAPPTSTPMIERLGNTSAILFDSPNLKPSADSPNLEPSVDSPNLKPPSQKWIVEQFDKSMSLLDWKYSPPNQWERCSLRTYYFPKINTIFTGVPKTGCSNWLFALVRAEGELTKEIPLKKIVPFVHGNATNIHRITNIRDRYESSVFRKAFSFAVVRNPWTRMVSGFRDKLSGENEKRNDPYRPIGRAIVREIRGVRDPDMLQGLYPTFPEYAKWMVKKGYHRDSHFNPQIKELCIQHAVYDFIVPLEYSQSLGDEVWHKIDANETNLLGSYDEAFDPRYQKSTLYAKEWLTQLNTELTDRLYTTFKADFTLMNYSNFTHPDFPLPLHG